MIIEWFKIVIVKFRRSPIDTFRLASVWIKVTIRLSFRLFLAVDDYNKFVLNYASWLDGFADIMNNVSIC